MTMEKQQRLVKTLRRYIKEYQKKLLFQLECEAESILDGGERYDAEERKKYETILSDLAIIKRAVEKGESTIKIYGTAESRCKMYHETEGILKKAGMYTHYYYGDGLLHFFDDEKYPASYC